MRSSTAREQGERQLQWAFPFPLMSKGERKKSSMMIGGARERKDNDERGSVSIAIDDKMGDC